MQIVIDLDTRKPQRSLTDSRTATQFDFKRGDDAVLEILFVRAGVQTQLTVGIALTFGVKLRGRYDSTPLVQTNDFTLSGSGATAKYIGYPSFNTAELNEAFGIDDSETNDVAVLDLMGEISWTEPTTEILTSSETFSVRVNNDVNREDDAPPNALPSPSDWLDARAVRFDKAQTLTAAQKQIARGNTGAETAGAAALAQAAAIAASQPLDSDLTAYANAADAAARRALLALAPDTTGNTNLNAILAAGPALSRTAIDAARLSAANSFGGLQKLAIPGPFATDAEANTFGVPDDNIYYRSDGTVRAASHISLDLAFALDKTLTARTGPTPAFTRASGATYVGSDGLIHGIDTSTTSVTFGTGSKTVTLSAPLEQDQMWRVGNEVEIVNTAGALMLGTVVSYTASTQVLVCNITSITGTGTFDSWRIGYRGARFGHDSTGVCMGMLREGSRSNICLRSGDLANGASWAGVSFTATPNATTAPDGTLTGVRLAAAAALNRWEQGVSVVAGSSYVFSFYVKKGTASSTIAKIWNSTSGGAIATLNYSTATSLTQWVRIQIPFTVPVGCSAVALRIRNDDSLGDSFHWGAQLEAGAEASSYIPTTTAPATRGEDVCSITGEDFGLFYNRLACTVYASFTPETIALPTAVCGTNDPRDLEIQMIGGGNIVGLSQTSTGSTAQLLRSGVAVGVRQNFAFASESNNQAVCLNGGAVLASPTWVKNSVAPTTFHIGRAGFSGQYSGYIQRITVYRKRLSNAKLQALTAP